jgi:hypothetical protein
MIPDKNNIKWKELLTGKIKHNFKSVPAGLLIARLTRQCQNCTTDQELSKNIQEAYDFFEKYQSLFSDDINAIFK